MERKGDWMKLLTIIYWLMVMGFIFMIIHAIANIKSEPQIIKITTENGEVVYTNYVECGWGGCAFRDINTSKFYTAQQNIITERIK